ncbi:putative F-box protein At3g52320 [Bidens hawaiensis]|uniref:putative F-box protein At3g52320 n=1 Tax=Bidens hawaiensis TaxID=980011 RepID=UPI00404B53EB
MSCVPDEIHQEIMKRLPVKSLIRFRSVSKPWKSHINSSDFIIKHSRTQSHHHLLVKDRDDAPGHGWREIRDDTYVSIVDDDTFPKQKVFWRVPLYVKMLECPKVIGTSHGLMCLRDRKRDLVFLWNISIRKVVGVVVPPNENKYIYGTVLGFGGCRETNDPKIVNITFHDDNYDYDYDDDDDLDQMGKDKKSVYHFPPEVEVFTLSTGAWRSSYGNLPRESIRFCTYDTGVAIDGLYYWLATDTISVDDNNRNIIISFDMASEEFREVTLPLGLSLVSMSKLGESLVVFGPNKHAIDFCYDVWMIGDRVQQSFTRLFTFTPKEDALVRGFRKSGEPIINVPEGYENELVVYDPYSKHVNDLGIERSHCSFEVYNYMETLFLLDKPNFMVYNDI